jgi:FAD/FMN-containing dehydrogenase
MLENYESWGRYPKLKPSDVIKINWQDQIPALDSLSKHVLPYGYGKSYGDSCLNENGVLLDVSGLNRFISFDRQNGLFCCQAGASLASILDFIVPQGWFLASTPGTKYISVGGAVANDVHGKNHHREGTFGANVTRFELLRSDGSRMICSPTENVEMFKATIGGLGLTGLILWVEFRLKPCPSAFIASESLKFKCLDEFFDIDSDSDKDYEFTVSWVDCTAKGSILGRGLYNRGNHADPAQYQLPKLPQEKIIAFPIEAPFINPLSVCAFNVLYYDKQTEPNLKQLVHYNQFFYPLDAVLHWNKAYGRNGFLQYQFVLPFGDERRALRRIMKYISESGMPSFLTVLKRFGDKKSPGMLSFPRSGYTLAVDFRFLGERTLKLCSELDAMVRQYGGVIYPAKDARMSADDFQHFYPNWTEFSKYIDPKFSSSFWRRVTQE